MRQDWRVQLATVATLALVFSLLVASLWVLGNLRAVATAWRGPAKLSVYVRDGADADAVQRLRLTLVGLPQVARVQRLRPEDARRALLSAGQDVSMLRTLPVVAFPLSFEVTLKAGTTLSALRTLSRRLKAFSAVEAVDGYEAGYGRVQRLLQTSDMASMAMLWVVMLAVLGVVANTIRLAVSQRQVEIDVMRYCGASPGYIRAPFIVEGMAQSMLAALLALAGVALLSVFIEGRIGANFAAWTGQSLRFLPLTTMLLFLAGALVAGGVGSLWALGRDGRV
ncbi:MAG: cell division protein FtsX [Polyangiales bacterium]